MSPEFKEVLHNFIVPVALGFALTVFKIMSELKDLENNEWSGVALDLTLVSVGSFAFYMKGRDPLCRNRKRSGYALMQLALGVGAFVWTNKAF